MNNSGDFIKKRPVSPFLNFISPSLWDLFLRQGLQISDSHHHRNFLQRQYYWRIVDTPLILRKPLYLCPNLWYFTRISSVFWYGLYYLRIGISRDLGEGNTHLGIGNSVSRAEGKTIFPDKSIPTDGSRWKLIFIPRFHHYWVYVRRFKIQD